VQVILKGSLGTVDLPRGSARGQGRTQPGAGNSMGTGGGATSVL
jgi:hypothetical protein